MRLPWCWWLSCHLWLSPAPITASPGALRVSRVWCFSYGLGRPGDDRNDPWYFGFLHLMPRRVIKRITADGRSAGSDQEYITELLHEYPQIAGSARYLIRTGDDLGRYFGLLMAEHTHAESFVTDVVQLLTGNVLRKDRKRQAMEYLADRG